MADSTEGDTMVLYMDILAPALITLIAGLVIHSFIIVVNVNDWWKGRSVTPVDHIITSLGISRICAHCAVILYLYIDLFFPKSLNFNLSKYITNDIIDSVNSFFNYANFWLTSLLSIVFCLKISSLRTRLFLYLRRMIEQRTAYLIVASGLLATLNCLFPLLTTLSDVMKSGEHNTSIENLLQNCSYISYICNYTIGSIIPLLFFCISSVLLFSSLYHHTRRMKISGNLSINLETYYSAMKFVSITFIYNIIYFTCCLGTVIYYYFYCKDCLWLNIVLGFLPALHSSYLIYRTAKLRSQMSKVLQNVTDFLFQRKDLETREEIDIVDQ